MLQLDMKTREMQWLTPQINPFTGFGHGAMSCPVAKDHTDLSPYLACFSGH